MKTETLHNIRRLLAAGVVAASIFMWLQGFIQSPMVRPEIAEQRKFTEKYLQENAPDLQAERNLAEAYWTRYRDVKEDSHFGSDGPTGIFGARAHYNQHGKREGRVFGPIPAPDDLVLEQQLAELYWRRYPKIEQSAAWGRKSQLGILGPRDHYHYHGRHSDLRWGEEPAAGKK